MTLNKINSNPSFLDQAKEFFNKPVVKNTAIALASLAAAAAVASVVYNNHFQNTPKNDVITPKNDVMFTEAFSGIICNDAQCVNITLQHDLAKSLLPKYLIKTEHKEKVVVNAHVNDSQTLTCFECFYKPQPLGTDAFNSISNLARKALIGVSNLSEIKLNVLKAFNF